MVLQARVNAGFPPRVSGTVRSRQQFEKVVDKVEPHPRPNENPALTEELASIEIAEFVTMRETNRRRMSLFGTDDIKAIAGVRRDEYDQGKAEVVTTTIAL